MSLIKEKKKVVVEKFKAHGTDTGSPRVQIALLTERINELTGHFRSHVKDHQSRQGLLKMVSLRRRLLTYLKTHQPAQYKKTLEELNLRR